MKRIILIAMVMASTIVMQARTLIVYYSYTNNINKIVTELGKQIAADVVRIEPAEKGLDYEANNYAIGSAQISAIRNNPDDASSYPEIDPVDVNLTEYDCIIIGAPLWWGQMAAPLQTYLFHNGSAMAGKHIGLIVSSASSGISGVESDAKRLIPEGDFLTPSLWIRSSEVTNSSALVTQWLKDIDYEALAGVESVLADIPSTDELSVYTVSGVLIGRKIASMENLAKGLYIVNRKKVYKGN